MEEAKACEWRARVEEQPRTVAGGVEGGRRVQSDTRSSWPLSWDTSVDTKHSFAPSRMLWRIVRQARAHTRSRSPPPPRASSPYTCTHASEDFFIRSFIQSSQSVSQSPAHLHRSADPDDDGRLRVANPSALLPFFLPYPPSLLLRHLHHLHLLVRATTAALLLPPHPPRWTISWLGTVSRVPWACEPTWWWGSLSAIQLAFCFATTGPLPQRDATRCDQRRTVNAGIASLPVSLSFLDK